MHHNGVTTNCLDCESGQVVDGKSDIEDALQLIYCVIIAQNPIKAH
jgi:hypothetical protein